MDRSEDPEDIALPEAERQRVMLAERDRIAREMHDSLGQFLGVAHLRLLTLLARPETKEVPAIRAELADLADMCHAAYSDVREAILGLRTSAAADATFVENLASYVQWFSSQSGIPTALDAPAREVSLSPSGQAQAIRVVQEALTNVRKHSGASRAAVRIRQTATATTVVVEDDGNGFDPDAVREAARGFGLVSMQERTDLVDGRLTIDSGPGRGTTVSLTIPG